MRRFAGLIDASREVLQLEGYKTRQKHPLIFLTCNQDLLLQPFPIQETLQTVINMANTLSKVMQNALGDGDSGGQPRPQPPQPIDPGTYDLTVTEASFIMARLWEVILVSWLPLARIWRHRKTGECFSAHLEHTVLIGLSSRPSLRGWMFEDGCARTDPCLVAC